MTGNDTGNHIENHTENHARNHTRNHTENHTENHAGNHTGNYTRNHAGNHTGNYIGNHARNHIDYLEATNTADNSNNHNHALQLEPIHKAYLDFCIKLLNQSCQVYNYNSVMVCALTVLGV